MFKYKTKILGTYHIQPSGRGFNNPALRPHEDTPRKVSICISVSVTYIRCGESKKHDSLPSILK